MRPEEVEFPVYSVDVCTERRVVDVEAIVGYEDYKVFLSSGHTIHTSWNREEISREVGAAHERLQVREDAEVVRMQRLVQQAIDDDDLEDWQK